MGRRRDNAPIGHTCPIIDDVIALMENAKSEAEWMNKNPDEDSASESNMIIDFLSDAIRTIEKVREANETLRDWGNDLYEELDNANKEISELEEENSELGDRISELEQKVDDLEYDLNEK